MLDQFSIFTKSGILLWSKTWCRAKEDLLRGFIEQVLIEKRGGRGTSTEMGNYAFEWSFVNDLNLVFVAIYQRMVPLLYITDLVSQIREVFSCLLLGHSFLPFIFLPLSFCFCFCFGGIIVRHFLHNSLLN